jgi:NAD-dependent SIR2 family protein deacetylase
MYASGKFAYAICDRCGFRVKYLALIDEPQTHLKVCEECLDEPWPERTTKPDAIVLREPRPDPFEGTEVDETG